MLDIHKLADVIATELLTVRHTGDREIECTRMACMSKDSGKEVSLGGRNKQSMVQAIVEVLRDA